MITSRLLGIVLAGNILMVLSGMTEALLYINYGRDYLLIAIGRIFGEILGSLIFALLSEFIGRKYTLLAITVPFIAGFFVSELLFRDSSLLFIGIALLSFSVGGTFTVLPIYIVEISESENRGKLIATAYTSFIGGIFLVSIFHTLLYYYMDLLTCVALIVIFIIWFAIIAPESPYYSLKKGHQDILRTTLNKLRGENDNNEIEFLEMIGKDEEEHNIVVNERIMPCLKARGWAKSVIMILAVTISERVIYSGSLLETKSSDQIIPIFIGFAQLLASCSTPILVDVFGRKLLLIIGYGLTAASSAILLLLIPIGRYTTNVVITEKFAFAMFSLVYHISRVIGIAPVRIILIAELFASNKRMLASAIFSALFFGINCITSLHKYHSYDGYSFVLYMFIFVIIIAIIMPIIIAIFYIETKGKSLKEIQLILNN